MARRLLEPDPATGQRRFTNRAFCYRGYRTSDLAYAITGHSAQGATVHTGITLVTGSEDRQWLYPAMTRGTDTNMAFVFTTPPRPADPQPGTRPAPELDRYERIRNERDGFLPGQAPAPGPGSPDPREPIAVLADVLDRDGAELSASADQAAQPGQRRPPRHPHTRSGPPKPADAHNDRYRDLVMAALPPGYRQDCPTRPGGCSAPCGPPSWPAWTLPRSPVRPSPPVTWPAPGISPASSTPGSGSASPAAAPAAGPMVQPRAPSCPIPAARPT